MPGKRPAEVEDCVKSMMKKNPGMDEGIAWGTCHKMHNQGKLKKKSESVKQEVTTGQKCDPCGTARILSVRLEKKGHSKPEEGAQRMSVEMRSCVVSAASALLKAGVSKEDILKQAQATCRSELRKMKTLSS